MQMTSQAGGCPTRITFGSPSPSLTPIYEALCTHSDSVAAGDYNDVPNQKGPPTSDEANGRAIFDTHNAANAEMLFFGTDAADEVFRVIAYGWRPITLKTFPVLAEDRAAVLAEAQWVRRPLFEVVATLGAITFTASTQATTDWGLSNTTLLAKTITKVADYTVSQNVRALASGVSDVAALFFDVSGFAKIEIYGTVNDGDAGTNNAASFGCAVALL